jgi:hypothetical protein
MIEQKIFCDIVGCHKDITHGLGGGLVFQSLNGQRTVHLCREHWQLVVRTLLPLIEKGVTDESMAFLNVDSDTDSGDTDRNIREFKKKE